jgi:hypothetical protein
MAETHGDDSADSPEGEIAGHRDGPSASRSTSAIHQLPPSSQSTGIQNLPCRAPSTHLELYHRDRRPASDSRPRRHHRRHETRAVRGGGGRHDGQRRTLARVPAAPVNLKQRRGSWTSRTATPPATSATRAGIEGTGDRQLTWLVTGTMDRDKPPATLRALVASCKPRGQSATWRADEQADTTRGHPTRKACRGHRRTESNDPAEMRAQAAGERLREPTRPRGRDALGMPGRQVQEQKPPRTHE